MSGDGNKSTHFHDEEEPDREGTSPAPETGTAAAGSIASIDAAMHGTESQEAVQPKDANGDDPPFYKDGEKADGGITPSDEDGEKADGGTPFDENGERADRGEIKEGNFVDNGDAAPLAQATAHDEGAGIATPGMQVGVRGESTTIDASDAPVDDIIDKSYHELALVEKTMMIITEPTVAAGLQATAQAGRTKIKGLLMAKADNLKIAIRYANGPAKDAMERDIEDAQCSIAAIEAAEHEATGEFTTPPRTKGPATSRFPGTAFSRRPGTGATPTDTLSISIPTEMPTDGNYDRRMTRFSFPKADDGDMAFSMQASTPSSNSSYQSAREHEYTASYTASGQPKEDRPQPQPVVDEAKTPKNVEAKTPKNEDDDNEILKKRLLKKMESSKTIQLDSSWDPATSKMTFRQWIEVENYDALVLEELDFLVDLVSDDVEKREAAEAQSERYRNIHLGGGKTAWTIANQRLFFGLRKYVARSSDQLSSVTIKSKDCGVCLLRLLIEVFERASIGYFKQLKKRIKAHCRQPLGLSFQAFTSKLKVLEDMKTEYSILTGHDFSDFAIYSALVEGLGAGPGKEGGTTFWSDVHKQESRPWLEGLEKDIKAMKSSLDGVTKIHAFDVEGFTKTMKFYEKRLDERLDAEKAQASAEKAQAMSAVESIEPLSEVAKLEEKLDKVISDLALYATKPKDSNGSKPFRCKMHGENNTHNDDQCRGQHPELRVAKNGNGNGSGGNDDAATKKGTFLGQCYNCHQVGHPASRCPKKNAEHAAFAVEPTEFAMMAVSEPSTGPRGGFDEQDNRGPVKPKCEWAYNGCVEIHWASDSSVKINPSALKVPEQDKYAP